MSFEDDTSDSEINIATNIAELHVGKVINHISKQLSKTGVTECVECGKPIPPERLAALPSADTCIDCASAAEAALRKKRNIR